MSELGEDKIIDIQRGLRSSGDYEFKVVNLEPCEQDAILHRILSAVIAWDDGESSTVQVGGWPHFVRLTEREGGVLATVCFESLGYGPLRLFAREREDLRGCLGGKGVKS